MYRRRNDKDEDTNTRQHSIGRLSDWCPLLASGVSHNAPDMVCQTHTCLYQCTPTVYQLYHGTMVCQTHTCLYQCTVYHGTMVLWCTMVYHGTMVCQTHTCRTTMSSDERFHLLICFAGQVDQVSTIISVQ